jgi:L-threonylcarbamoyladenylate synthase
MQILQINQDNPESQILALTSQVLLNGEVIIHPTETVYGLASVFQRTTAIKKILNIKRRPYNHPMSIMVSDIDQILEISGVTDSDWLREMLRRLLPAPLTVLLPRKKYLDSDYWDQYPNLGFRFPDHVLSRRLLEKTGEPLITTSANLSGEPAPLSVQELPPDLKQKVSIILDGGQTKEKTSSTIVEIDLVSRDIKKVRKGALSWQEIVKRIDGSI